MTYLELINKVLTRLRESPVTSSSAANYTKLIGELVNQSKRAVEDCTDWNALRATLTVTTADGTSDYTLTGANERATVDSVVLEADKFMLHRSRARDLIRMKQINPDTSKPTKWSIIGTSSGDLVLRLHPTPDGVYSLSVNAITPDDDLEDDADPMSIPWEPVVIRAYAYAIKERGEDQGQAYAEALDEYRRALSRYIILNGSQKGGTGKWQVV